MSETLDSDHVTRHHSRWFPRQAQQRPGLTSATTPRPDHGEKTSEGSGRLVDKRALITGGDSGIGRTVGLRPLARAHRPRHDEGPARRVHDGPCAAARRVRYPGRRGASRPIRPPLMPATKWPDTVGSFGQHTPLGRAGQPAEPAPDAVFPASAEASYVSGAVVAVTGGKGL